MLPWPHYQSSVRPEKGPSQTLKKKSSSVDPVSGNCQRLDRSDVKHRTMKDAPQVEEEEFPTQERGQGCPGRWPSSRPECPSQAGEESRGLQQEVSREEETALIL